MIIAPGVEFINSGTPLTLEFTTSTTDKKTFTNIELACCRQCFTSATAPTEAIAGSAAKGLTHSSANAWGVRYIFPESSLSSETIKRLAVYCWVVKYLAGREIDMICRIKADPDNLNIVHGLTPARDDELLQRLEAIAGQSISVIDDEDDALSAFSAIADELCGSEEPRAALLGLRLLMAKRAGDVPSAEMRHVIGLYREEQVDSSIFTWNPVAIQAAIRCAKPPTSPVLLSTALPGAPLSLPSPFARVKTIIRSELR